MLVPAYLHLKRAAVVFMSISFEVVASLMSSWGLALFSCTQTVGARRALGECFNKMSSHDMVTWNAILGGCAMLGERSKRCHLKMWSLGPP